MNDRLLLGILLAAFVALVLLCRSTSAGTVTMSWPLPVASQGLNYQIEVSWQNAEYRTDGTPMEAGDIAKTRIYFGMTYGDLSGFIDVPGSPDPGARVWYTLNVPAPGLWFIAVTTFDIYGTESSMSEVTRDHAVGTPQARFLNVTEVTT